MVFAGRSLKWISSTLKGARQTTFFGAVARKEITFEKDLMAPVSLRTFWILTPIDVTKLSSKQRQSSMVVFFLVFKWGMNLGFKMKSKNS